MSGNDRVHARAVLTLVSSRKEKAAEMAVEMLQDLAGQKPSDPRIWSDLSAAYFVRAQRGDQPSDLVWALEMAEKALDIRDFPEARFNQALALQALSLHPPARRAWNRHIELDPDSGWTEEARRRLREIESVDGKAKWEADKETLRKNWQDQAMVRRIVDSHRAAARFFVEEEALPSWAAAEEKGLEPEARENLALAEVVADQLAELNGDQLLSHAAAAIRQAANPRDPVRLRLLIEGHQAYGVAARHYRQFETKEAQPFYVRASQALTKAKSPFAAWADVGQSACEYVGLRYKDALRRLSRVARQAEELGYRSLLGRVKWIYAAGLQGLGRPVEALQSHGAALELFRLAGERENIVNVQARLADDLEGMGERQLAWRYRYQAIQAAPDLYREQDSSFVFLDAAIAARGLDLFESAIHFLEESDRLAAKGEHFVHRAFVTLDKINAHRRTSDMAQARVNLERARQICAQVATLQLGPSYCSRVRVVEGLILLEESRPEAAYDSLTAALEWLRQTDERGYLAYIYLQRAKAARDAGRVSQAEEDLTVGKQMIEEEWDQVFNTRERGENEDLWLAYFSSPRQIFDLLIDLLWQQGRTSEAFSIAEQAQARDLLDLIPSTDLLEPSTRLRRFQRTARPLVAAEIQSRLKAGKALVAYRTLEDRLLIWLVRQNQIYAFQVERPRHEIEQLTAKIHEHAENGQFDENFRDLIQELHAVLVAKIRPKVEDEEELVFVPEGPIHGVPFAVLRNPSTGRYLIQDHPVSIAPSATLHVYSEQRNRTLSQGSRTALLIGDPKFNKVLFPNLDRLKGAAAETERIRPLYPGSAVLTGAEATKQKVFELSPRHAILHFAGHARANPRYPSRSVLILAPSAGDTGALYGHELLHQDLSSVRLVVLSACSTAGGQPIGALGVSSLVRPFLAAGVPAVVGSLWDVGDPATRELLFEFHTRFKRGDDAAAALRGAQLELLQGNRALRSPLSWAPFQVIGTASFRED